MWRQGPAKSIWHAQRVNIRELNGETVCRIEARVRKPAWTLATLKAITTSKKELATSKKPTSLLDLKGEIEGTVLLGQD